KAEFVIDVFGVDQLSLDALARTQLCETFKRLEEISASDYDQIRRVIRRSQTRCSIGTDVRRPLCAVIGYRQELPFAHSRRRKHSSEPSLVRLNSRDNLFRRIKIRNVKYSYRPAGKSAYPCLLPTVFGQLQPVAIGHKLVPVTDPSVINQTDVTGSS